MHPAMKTIYERKRRDRDTNKDMGYGELNIPKASFKTIKELLKEKSNKENSNGR